MRTQRTWRVVVATSLLMSLWLGLGTLAAHHSFAMFDTGNGKAVTLSGTVTVFEWTNPHAYIEIDVPEAGGAIKHWTIELGSPSILQQSGWTFKSLKHGDKITVNLSPLRNGDPGGLLVYATLADGKILGNGPGRGPANPARGAAPAAGGAAPAGNK